MSDIDDEWAALINRLPDEVRWCHSHVLRAALVRDAPHR